MDKKRLLFLSDSPLTCTGYATICKHISNYMTGYGWDVHVLAHNYTGQTLAPGTKFLDGTTINFTLHGAGREAYCKDLIIPKIKELKPDIFMILLDTFMLYPWLLELNFAPAKSIFYFPSDGGGQLPTNCDQILRQMTLPVAMAKFGQKQALEVHGLKTDYIPHAIDTSLYKPMKDKEKAALKAKWGLTGKFVVGTVARNQGRKMMDRTIKAFAIFCKDKPDAILFLHTDPNDAAATFDIRSLIMQYGLENRAMFSGMNYYKGFDYKDMNNVYNLMDIFILSTSGEGFGIPIIEAMGAGIPVVVTDYTTTKELVIDHDCGEAPKVAAEITGSWNVERAVWDDKDAAKKLTKMYNDEDLLKKYSKNGRAAVLKHYDWKKVSKDWFKLMEKLTNEI